MDQIEKMIGKENLKKIQEELKDGDFQEGDEIPLDIELELPEDMDLFEMDEL